MNTGEKIALILGNKPNSLMMSYNEHWLSGNGPVRLSVNDNWLSRNEWDAAFKNNSVWEVTYFPDTPVGSIQYLACTLDAALDALISDLKQAHQDGYPALSEHEIKRIEEK